MIIPPLAVVHYRAVSSSAASLFGVSDRFALHFSCRDSNSSGRRCSGQLQRPAGSEQTASSSANLLPKVRQAHIRAQWCALKSILRRPLTAAVYWGVPCQTLQSAFHCVCGPSLCRFRIGFTRHTLASTPVHLLSTAYTTVLGRCRFFLSRRRLHT